MLTNFDQTMDEEKGARMDKLNNLFKEIQAQQEIEKKSKNELQNNYGEFDKVLNQMLDKMIGED